MKKKVSMKSYYDKELSFQNRLVPVGSDSGPFVEVVTLVGVLCEVVLQEGYQLWLVNEFLDGLGPILVCPVRVDEDTVASLVDTAAEFED